MIADQAVRDRLLEELDRTFIVEAGAGTGKTTILVGRIVNLVARGRVQMEGLVAITFTEAAAAELRDRVREGLERAAGDPAHPADELARCQQAVGEIDLAAISTIHAFALNLLRTYPLEAGLPPGFSTLDEIEQGVAFEERWGTWFWGAALEEPARGVLRRALLLGLTQEHLRALAQAVEAQYDLLSADTTWPAPPAEDALPQAHAAGRTLADLAPLTAHAVDGRDDPLAQVVVGAQSLARRLRAATTMDEALAALTDAGQLKRTVGSQKNWGTLPDGRNACTAIKAALKAVVDDSTCVVASHRAATFAAVLALLRDFTLAGVAARKAEGQAIFQDLLVWARDLLRDHPAVRRRAQARYQRILLDEFQDTDPLQAEIAFYLAAEPEAPLTAHWAELRLVPGKLFVVGDPKQSIYRFRRADIAVYDALLRRLPDAPERLVQNFRSVRPVLEWVNHHFAVQMVEAAGCQPPYVRLEPHREACDDAACGVYRLGESIPVGAAAAATVEAQTIAALAGSVVAERWLLADDGPTGTGPLRPARYRDLAILLPSRTHLRRLERALEDAGVPYRLESGALLLATQEVRDLLAGLRAIADPSDEVALVGALRSPAFACADPDLVRWVEGGGRLSFENPGDGPDGPVKDALACLAGFHARRHTLSPPALIEAYLRERLLVIAAYGEPRPREAWRRLRYVVARARAFTTTGRHTLRAFLDWIDGLARAEVRDAESAEAEPDEDALRILTVHGAKGLEFPVVFLAGLGSARRGRATGVAVFADRERGVLACRAGAWQTADFDTVQEREKVMEAAEAVRLLYVAGTRARDYLVLSLYRGSRAETSPAALIEQGFQTAAHLGLRYTAASSGAPTHSTADGSRAPNADQAEETGYDAASEEAWLADRRHLVEQLAAPPAVVAPAADLTRLWRSLGDDDLSLATREVSGSAVHALLRRASGGALRPDDSGDSAAVAGARAVLASPAYQRAVQSGACWQQVSLLATVDGVLLDLVADLVYEGVEGTVLVIYELADRRQDARPAEPWTASQKAGLLALAFRAATGRQPSAVEIVHAAEGGAVTRLDDLPAIMAEASSILRPPSGAELQESQTRGAPVL
jgi:ATP-dependent exoDNAse (exonuclease V) beta subunit